VPDLVVSTHDEPYRRQRGRTRLVSGRTGRELDLGRAGIHVAGPHAEHGLATSTTFAAWRERATRLHAGPHPTRAARAAFLRGWITHDDRLDDLDGDGIGEVLLTSQRVPDAPAHTFLRRSRTPDPAEPFNVGFQFADEAGCRAHAATRWPAGRVLGSRTGRIEITERAVSGTQHALGPGGANQARVVGDLDGDGVRDFVVVGARPEFGCGRDGRALHTLDLDVLPGEGSVVLPGDQDGDGSPEILFLSALPGRLAVPQVVRAFDGRVLAELAPEPTRWPERRRQCLPETIGWPISSPGDVDRDGRDDVVRGTRGGLEIVRATDGSRIALLPREIEAEVEPGRGRADFDADGHPDLLVVVNRGWSGDPSEPRWRLGRVEVVSGRTLEILRTFDARTLGLATGAPWPAPTRRDP
jgi:hypothetical protein